MKKRHISNVSAYLVIAELILASALVMPLPPSYAANDSDEFTTTDAPRKTRSTVTSNQALNIGAPTTGSLHMEAEQALENNRVDEAIKLLRKANDLDDDDIDSHACLARALETKLQSQKKKDQSVLSECLSEWVKVMRNQMGDEKGMTFKGLSILNINALYTDDDRQGMAKAHLRKLAGSAPRPWETNNQYLNRVLIKNVEGELVSKEKSPQTK